MKYPEDNLQVQTARYLDLLGVLWFHPANERKTSIQAGKRLKLKGVKSGVPDVLIFEPKNDFNGLAIELKIKPNKVSLNQKKWLKSLEKNKWSTHIAYSLDEVINIVENYLK